MCKPTTTVSDNSPTCPRCEEGNWDNEDGTCDNCGAVNPGPEPDWDAFSDGYGDFERDE